MTIPFDSRLAYACPDGNVYGVPRNRCGLLDAEKQCFFIDRWLLLPLPVGSRAVRPQHPVPGSSPLSIAPKVV